MNTLHVDCELNYDLWEPTVFIFNLAVPFSYEERVFVENLVVNPDASIDSFLDQGTGNRFTRVCSSASTLSVRYLATIEAPPVPNTTMLRRFIRQHCRESASRSYMQAGIASPMCSLVTQSRCLGNRPGDTRGFRRYANGFEITSRIASALPRR